MKYEEQNIDELLADIEKLLGDEPKKPASASVKKKPTRPAGRNDTAQPVRKNISEKTQKKSSASKHHKKTSAKKRKQTELPANRKHSKTPKSAPAPQQPSLMKRFASDTKKYFRYSVVSAKAKLKSEVANSYLNWIWWVLEPLCFMLIYAFIFGYVFKAREPFFAVYIFVGLTLWTFFDKTIKSSVKIIKTNKSIVSKVYFPKYILLFTKIMVNGFKMVVSYGIIVVMILIFKVPFSWNMIYAIPILITLVLLTFGCSCFLLHFGVYVEDLSNIVSIISRMLFYLTGIFYNLETRIPEYGALFNTYNPMAFLLSSMRSCLLYGESPNLIFLIAWFVVSLLLSVAGVRKIYKEENSYVKAI